MFIFIFEMNTHIQEKRNAVLTSNIKGHHKLYTHELVYLYIYIYIYKLINRQILEKIQLDSTIEVQFYIMCPKLFIFRESFIS